MKLLDVLELDDMYPGIVPPAFLRGPRFVRTLGPEVAAVNTLAGYVPDPEQQLGLDLTFAIDDRGRSACAEIVCLCCRQNLKTGLVKMIENGWLFVTDERLVVHSAHEFNTSREAYRDLKELIEGSPVLRKRIKPNGFKDTPADMSIETVTGARLVFKTRTKGGGRGLSGRKIVLDEAFALKAMHMGALRPLISAQPDPQIVYASSAALEDSEVLHSLVKRGRGTLDEPRLAYLEWCMPSPAEACKDGDGCRHVYGVAQGCALDDLGNLKAANPAIGRRIAVETILDERRACVSEVLAHEFGRERGGWHDEPAEGVQVIDAEKWLAARHAEGKLRPESLALAFDVQPGNVGAAITVAGRLQPTPDVVAQALDLGLDLSTMGRLSPIRVEITGRDADLDCRAGTDWLVDRLASIAEARSFVALGYDPASPAGAFRQALLDTGRFVELDDDKPTPRGKVRLVKLTGRDYAQACGALDADVRNGSAKHYAQKPLDDAVEGARAQEDASGSWKWSRKDSSVNIAPLVAATIARQMCAVYGGRKSKPAPFAVSL